MLGKVVDFFGDNEGSGIEKLDSYEVRNGSVFGLEKRVLEVRKFKGRRSSLAGEFFGVFKGRGMEFDSVREYVVGDDVRNIDWNVSARTGKTHVKEFHEEKENVVSIIADLGEEMFFSSRGKLKYDVMVEIVASICFAARKNGEKVQSIFYGDNLKGNVVFRDVNNRSRLTQILKFLTEKDKRGIEKKSVGLVESLKKQVDLINNEGVAFVICGSNEIDDELFKQMMRLKRRQVVYFCYIFDEVEYDLPSFRNVSFCDKNGEVRVLSLSKKERVEYKEKSLKRKKEFLRKCKELGVKPVFFDCEGDVLKNLKVNLL